MYELIPYIKCHFCDEWFLNPTPKQLFLYATRINKCNKCNDYVKQL